MNIVRYNFLENKIFSCPQIKLLLNIYNYARMIVNFGYSDRLGNIEITKYFVIRVLKKECTIYVQCYREFFKLRV